jgi:hypothetical protein
MREQGSCPMCGLAEEQVGQGTSGDFQSFNLSIFQSLSGRRRHPRAD